MMKPEWTEVVINECNLTDTLLHRRKGTSIKAIEWYLDHATYDQISRALETGYLLFESDSSDSVLHLGPFVIKPLTIHIPSDYMMNWNEYLWELLTIKRLGG